MTTEQYSGDHTHPDLEARIAALEAGDVPPVSTGEGYTDLPGWRLVFTDDFDDRTIEQGHFLDGSIGRRSVGDVTSDGRYGVAYWKDTMAKGQYSGDFISVQDGLLRVYVRTLDGVPQVADLKPITSESDPDTGGIEGPFRVAYRLRADAMEGYKVCNLLWATLASGGGMGDFMTYGEIDWPEGDTTDHPTAYMHRRNGADSGDQDYYPVEDASFGDWHEYAIEFTPDEECVFLLDGDLVGRSTERVPGGSPFRSMIRIETELTDTMPSKDVAGWYEIDRVGVWVPG